MTRRDLEFIKQRFPVSEAVIKRSLDSGDTGLRPSKPERIEGGALVSASPRKDSGRFVTSPRHRIRFTIYSVRPCDWDGYHIKELQDMLVRASIIPDDNWGFLQGEVISEKALSKEEEKTVIEITPLADQA